ncbi:MAG: ABC transporter substrate-binding protein [Gemmatimonadota bacterium]|nr:ABC transporter substrate-binding protein [Gemmatimonadota bacterium]
MPGRRSAGPSPVPPRHPRGRPAAPAAAVSAAAVSALCVAAVALAGCRAEAPGGPAVVTFPGSAVGAEAVVLRRQLERFMEARPDIRVISRPTPDAADQRHQLYVQWLNAGASTPDILQLDVVWTPEFAAAGWILPLDRFAPDTAAFFPATIAANRWDGTLFALPWFVDVGMLYWRTDLLDAAPRSFAEVERAVARHVGATAPPDTAGGPVPRYGFVWQGARYEGLVTVFQEIAGGFGGRILDERGRVAVDEEPAIRALTWMRDAVAGGAGPRVSPRTTLTWHEEEARFAFQNGQALLMRNWPYAVSLLATDPDSRVRGHFAIAPMPAAPGGEPTAALGGSQLAINARTEHPEAAWAVLEYLTRPEQMLERAALVGQYPTREVLYGEPELAEALGVDPAPVREIIARARPRPVSPVYTQLSEILQIRLHRALTGQAEPADALADAAREMRAFLRKVGLAPDGEGPDGG